jgi:biopolymer transport protein ExbD
MMTAVWTQIGRMQVASQGQGDPSPNNQPTLTLNLTLTERGYMLNAGATAIEIPKKDENYDTGKLLEELKKIKKENPDHRTITVAAEDAIEYQWVVQVVDTCITADLPDVTVTAALG